MGELYNQLMNYDFADRDLLLAVLAEVRDAVLVTDARLELPGPTIVYANPAFCDMTGYAPEEIEGQTPRLLQGPETDRKLMRQLKSQLAAKCLKPPGLACWLRWRARK